MRYLTAAVSAALVASAAADAYGDKVKDKITVPVPDVSVNKQKDKMQIAAPGRYTGLEHDVTIEEFRLTALFDGAAETDTDTLTSELSWAFRVDFEVQSSVTGEMRADSFDLLLDLSGAFDGSGLAGSFGGSGVIIPNGGTVAGIPLFDHLSAASGVIWLDLDRPILSLGEGDSLLALFRDTRSAGDINAALHVAPLYGGETHHVYFGGGSEWTRVPAPGSLAAITGSAWLFGLSRRARARTGPPA